MCGENFTKFLDCFGGCSRGHNLYIHPFGVSIYHDQAKSKCNLDRGSLGHSQGWRGIVGGDGLDSWQT